MVHYTRLCSHDVTRSHQRGTVEKSSWNQRLMFNNRTFEKLFSFRTSIVLVKWVDTICLCPRLTSFQVLSSCLRKIAITKLYIYIRFFSFWDIIWYRLLRITWAVHIIEKWLPCTLNELPTIIPRQHPFENKQHKWCLWLRFWPLYTSDKQTHVFDEETVNSSDFSKKKKV